MMYINKLVSACLCLSWGLLGTAVAVKTIYDNNIFVTIYGSKSNNPELLYR